MDMLDTVAAFIDQYRLLPPGGEVVVGVSGGADSLCLLHLLDRLCGPGKHYPAITLRGAHLNHRLRGEDSARDAAEVERIVTRWGLAFSGGEIDVPTLAHQERRSIEDAARLARYRFLREVARGQPIAVAHHADDQVETLLLHYLRGSGLSGMVGMQARQRDVIRPLLEVTHTQTTDYCRQHAITPLEDQSNSDPAYTRNRIRHQLLPLMESINPGFRATLLRSASVMRADLDFIETQVDASWPGVIVTEHQDAITLQVSALVELPLALQRQLLRRVTSHLCAGQSPLEPRHYTLIEQLMRRPANRQPRALDLPCCLRATRNFNEVTFERLSAIDSSPEGDEVDPIDRTALPAEVLLPIPGEVAVPGTTWIARAELLASNLLEKAIAALRREDWPEVWRLLPPSRYVVYIDASQVDSSLRVRTRRPGDRLQPLGMMHEKKVQDILVDNHVARPERNAMPLVFSASRCIWLAGVALDERARLTSKTELIARLSIVPVST